MEENKFWNEEAETMPLEKLRALQNEKLQTAVGYAYQKTAFYRNLFDQAGVKPHDVSTVDDLYKLPFTNDIEVAENVSLNDRLAVKEEDVKMYHSTSGTVGAVVPIPFSEKDKEAFFDQGECRARWTMGVRPSDVVQVLTRFDCCMLGYKRLGASLVLLSAGRYNPDHQMNMTKEAGVTVIEHMPSLLLEHFEKMEEKGISIRETDLRLISGVGEGWAESYKKQIEKKYGVPFMTLYGAVEISPFFAAECEARSGMHINADLGFMEVIDPETGRLLPEGEEGELVATLLQNEAMPLIRYRVGDLGRILPHETCSCGRTTPKISYVRGRASHLMQIGSKKILPIDIEEIVSKIDGLENEFRIVLDQPETDILKLKIEHKQKAENISSLKEKTEQMIFEEIGLKSEITLLPKGSLQRVTFKAQRVEREF